MNTPFRLAEHPRRRPQPLMSSPPAGYFEQLPTRVMARVAAPPRRPLAWRWPVPAAVRTALASTLVLGTFAASLWLGSPQGRPAAAAGLDAVPPPQLVEYLTSGETHFDVQDLADLPTRHLGLTGHYLTSSTSELTAALDAQPTDEAELL